MIIRQGKSLHLYRFWGFFFLRIKTKNPSIKILYNTRVLMHAFSHICTYTKHVLLDKHILIKKNRKKWWRTILSERIKKYKFVRFWLFYFYKKNQNNFINRILLFLSIILFSNGKTNFKHQHKCPWCFSHLHLLLFFIFACLLSFY